MDVQLQELIESIKKEGVDSAQARAAEIVSEAEKSAQAILAAAAAESARQIESGKMQAAQFERMAREALSQAGRDLVLSLEKKIRQLFDSVVLASTREGLTTPVLEQAILSLVSAWSSKRSEELEVLLSPADLARLEKGLSARLGDLMKKGLLLRPVSQIEAGFRIGEKNGAVYYDITAEGITQILTQYLNPKLGELLAKAVGKES
jgi:V/A-type H+-transporting ATPase subunit E